jgi:hypothetical protein
MFAREFLCLEKRKIFILFGDFHKKFKSPDIFQVLNLGREPFFDWDP